MMDWYNYSWMETIEKLESDENVGLNSERVKFLQERDGKNKIFQVEEKKRFPLIKKMIISPWFILLVISSGFMIASRHYISGALFLIFTIAGDLLYYHDEIIKINNVKQLERIDNINASVLRGGRIYKIPAEELVVGDIVFVEKGVNVPADLRIFECKNLKVKQTSVTGEIYEAEKYETKIEESDISLVEMKNMLFKSTIVTEGIGAGVVTAVGGNTEVGKIVKSLYEDKEREEIFQKFVGNSIVILEIIAVICTFFILGINFAYKVSCLNMLAKIALVLSSFLPITLLIILGVYFQAVKKYYKHNGIEIKNLRSIEAVCKSDMIIVQKLGFFSENKMEAVRLYTDETTIDLENEQIEISKNIERIIHIALLCNNNSKNNVEEKALIELGKNYSYDKYNLDSKFRRMFEIPYDVQRGIKTTVNKIEKKYRANVVGAVDKLLEACKFIMKNGIETEMTEEDIEKIKLADIDMSTACLNVAGFAYRNFKYSPSKDENIESYLVFVGLIGFMNPLKEDAVQALKDSADFGIGTIITSEDSKLTAISVGNNLGLKMSPENVLCGVELENMDEEALNNFISKVKILSRVTVKDKLRVINTLKSYEHNVLVTGINLTDLPLLESGDFRLAYSQFCSSTLKATADAYMMEENYDKILFFIDKSKMIYNKFLQLLKYSFAVSLSQGIFIMLYCSFNNLDLDKGFYIQQANFIFIILSFICFAVRNKIYTINIIFHKRIRYNPIIMYSVITGIISFGIVMASNFQKGIISYIICLLALPLSELILLNRKFNTW